MNYLIISPNSPYLSVGGIERYIKNLIRFCEDKPGKFYFFLPANSKTEVTTRGNVTIYALDFLSLSYKKRKGLDTREVSLKQIQDKSKAFFDFLTSFLTEKNIHAVVAQNFHLGLPPSFSLMLNMACYAKRVPVFLQVHSFAVTPLQSEIINSLFWERIICVSKSVAGDCFQKGAGIKRLTTKYLGVDTREFNTKVDRSWLKNSLHLSPNHRLILCASRILHGYRDILKEKGIINLLDAFSKIAPRDKNLRLLMAIGNPPHQLRPEFDAALRKLEGYTQIHGVQDQVILQSFPLDKMPLVYAGSDVFVLPSENETLGQVYIEAMACGLPVIGTNVGGIPEIISDSHNGFLILPNDASQLAQKIERLLSDQQLRKTFISNGFSTVAKQFNVDKIFQEYFKYLSDVVSNHSSSV